MAEQQSAQDAPAESAPAPAVTARRSTRGGLRTFDSLRDNRNYRFLFAGNISANGAQWLQLFTVGWLVLSISEGSALHSVAVAGIRSLPVLALGPWAGVLADRIDRRMIAITSHAAQVVFAVGFAVLIAGDWVQVWHAYSYMLLSGAAHAIQQPVRHALVANTVPRSDLANALALNAMGVNIMRLLGPLVGGLLISTVGFKWNFFFEAALYLGMALLLLPMKTPFREASTAQRVSAFTNLKDGIKYIVTSSPLRRLTLLNFLRTTVFMPLVLLMPVYTQDALGAGVGTGTFMIALMGCGGLATTILVATWGFVTKKGLVTMLALLTGSVVIFVLGLSHWVWLSLPLMVFMGLSQTHSVVSNNILIQSLVSDNLRGRVSSVWHYESGLIPLAAVAIGYVADQVNINTALIAVGATSAAISLISLIRFKDVRALD